MTNKEYLKFALASMHIGDWYGWRKEDDNGNKIPNDQRMTYENVIVIKDGITKPTEAEVNAKIEELKNINTEKTNNKTSAHNKLKALGLTDAEIKAL